MAADISAETWLGASGTRINGLQSLEKHHWFLVSDIAGILGGLVTHLSVITILAVVLFLGIYLPIHYYGGYGAMFTAIQAAKPGFLALPPQGESLAWFDSTVLLTALGFYMWPHTFGSLFTACSTNTHERRACVFEDCSDIGEVDVAYKAWGSNKL